MNNKLNEAQKYNFKSLLQTRNRDISPDVIQPSKAGVEKSISPRATDRSNFRLKSSTGFNDQPRSYMNPNYGAVYSASFRKDNTNLPLTNYYLNKDTLSQNKSYIAESNVP